MEASAAPAPNVRRGPVRLASPRLLRLASDERLVSAARDGSQAAYEVIYDRHHRGVLSFCRHMLGNREEAEDAVQHTFMAAYRDLLASDKPLHLRAWLYAVARNRCLSQLRARRERPASELGEPATEGLAAEVQRRADLQDMLRDVAALPEDQRAALVLSELGDMGHDEIGAVIGCPREKVKALVFQARSSLQSSRKARETSCGDIRELLSTLSGGALRRTELRRHLSECPGCRDFDGEVKRQRRAMAAVLPVVPTLALKDSALAAAFAGKGAASGAALAAGGAVSAGGSSALVAKALVVAAVASGGSVAGYQAVSGAEKPGAAAAESSRDTGAGTAGFAPAAVDEGSARSSGEPRRRGHSERGREWARTRGKGRKLGGLKEPRGRRVKAERDQMRSDRAAAREEVRAQRRAAASPPPRTNPALGRQKPKATSPVAPEPKAQAPRPVVPDASVGPATGGGRGKGKP